MSNSNITLHRFVSLVLHGKRLKEEGMTEYLMVSKIKFTNPVAKVQGRQRGYGGADVGLFLSQLQSHWKWKWKYSEDAVTGWSWGVYFWSDWQSHWIAEAVTTDAPVMVQTHDAPILKSSFAHEGCSVTLLRYKPMMLLFLNLVLQMEDALTTALVMV